MKQDDQGDGFFTFFVLCFIAVVVGILLYGCELKIRSIIRESVQEALEQTTIKTKEL